MNAITKQLLAPLNPKCVRWKPVGKPGKTMLVVPYLDAKAVIKRLDEIFGTEGWQDAYQPLASPAGSFLCTLRVKIDGEWIVKTDAGGTGEGSDKGNQAKAAASDALKRVASKLGIGRYLRHVSPQSVAYDEAAKRITGTPVLPKWALPEAAPKAA